MAGLSDLGPQSCNALGAHFQLDCERNKTKLIF